MRSNRAFTVVELLVVAGIITLLIAIVTPSIGAIRGIARRMTCASQLHQVGVALASYQGVHHFRMPPFAFSDPAAPNLSVSGHWGGPQQQWDPIVLRTRIRVPASVNLWALTAESILPPAALACPSSRFARDSTVSLFPHTQKFSSYCMRFPLSADLFSESPSLENYQNVGLLSIYQQCHSGQRVSSSGAPLGASAPLVPFMRTDRSYQLDPSVCFGRNSSDPRSSFNPAQDAVVSDLFWWPEMNIPATAGGKCTVFGRHGAWCHGRDFNALMGGGNVRCATDQAGVVAANCETSASTVDVGPDNLYYAQQAQKVWQFLDAESAVP